jgi:hypothetical protein
MRAIQLAAAIRLAGPDSEWASGSAMTWTTSSDDVLARLARRREGRCRIASADGSDQRAIEEQIEVAAYRNDLATLVLRECGLNTAFEEMLRTNEEALQPGLAQLLGPPLPIR